MKKITVFLLILALVSIPLMATESVTQSSPTMATMTADLGIPVAVSVDIEPLVEAIKEQTTAVSIGFTFLIVTALGISLGIYYGSRPNSSVLMAEVLSTTKPRKPKEQKPSSDVPLAESKKPEGIKRPRKPRAKSTTAALAT